MKHYFYIGNIHEGFRMVLNIGGYKFGFINANGEEICECKYNDGDAFCDGFALVCLINKWGVINTKGIEVINCEYKYDDVKIMLEKYKMNLNRIKKLSIIV